MKNGLVLALLLPLTALGAPPAGTEVVGEREVELGLNLSLWSDEQARPLGELPLRLLGEAPQALDAEAFRRGVDQDEARAAERREQLHRSQ